MSLEQIAPLRAALLARRNQPAPPIEQRRAGFEAQMAALPLPDNFTVTAAEMGNGMSGRICRRTESDEKRVILWFHGGAFVLGSSASYRPFAARLAKAAQATIILPDYRLAPEHCFPAAHDDAIAALEWLEAQDIAMSDIVIGGDSAGANLAVAAVQHRAAKGLQVPAALWVISPYLDLTHAGQSISARAGRDPFIDTQTMDETAKTYLGDAEPANLRASPLLGSFAGFPPTLIQVGTEEVLFDDAARLRDRLEAKGCETIFQAWVGMIHVWPLFAHMVEEGEWAIAQGGNFARLLWERQEQADCKFTAGP